MHISYWVGGSSVCVTVWVEEENVSIFIDRLEKMGREWMAFDASYNEVDLSEKKVQTF